VINETHRGSNHKSPKINGMRLMEEKLHCKYDRALFVKPELDIISTEITDNDNIEIMIINLKLCTITSINKPPGTPFTFKEPNS